MTKSVTRRDVLRGSAAGLGVLALPGWAFPALAQGEQLVAFTDYPEGWKPSMGEDIRLLDIRKIDGPYTPADQFFTAQHHGHPQISPIHDHAGSDGWIRCMDGAIEEVWYERADGGDGRSRFERGRAATLTPGGIGYINDDLAWHTVGNPGTSRTVTLHLYSPPIDSCQYVDDKGEIRTKSMSYLTMDGAPVLA